MAPPFFYFMHQRSDSKKIRFASQLRSRMTAAEKVFWTRVRCGQASGLRFRRQVVIAGYIADFYCRELQLVVEVDGPIHALQRGRDRRRDAAMQRLGLRVVRLSNQEVLSDVDAALAKALAESPDESDKG